MPAERDAIELYIGEGWTLIAAGARREQDGGLAADLLLRNGNLTFVNRGVLNTDEGRRTWITAASGDGRPSPEELERALPGIIPEVLSTLQEQPRQSQADQLVSMVVEEIKDPSAGLEGDDLELWHTPDGDAWGAIPVDNHREHWPLNAKGFRR